MRLPTLVAGAGAHKVDTGSASMDRATVTVTDVRASRPMQDIVPVPRFELDLRVQWSYCRSLTSRTNSFSVEAVGSCAELTSNGT